MPQCAGRTSNGAQCRRNVLDAEYCMTHRNQAAAAAAAAAAPAAEPAPPQPQTRRGQISRETIENLRSEDARRQLIALQNLRFVNSLPTINELDEKNVIERIIDLFFDSDVHRVRDSAIWVLINITASIGDFGARAILRVAPEFLTDAVHLLLVASPQIVEQTLWCLGNIAGSGALYTTRLLELDADTICIQFLENLRQPRELRKYAAFLLSNLAKHMNPEKAVETLEDLADLPASALKESEIMVEMVWTIQSLVGLADTLPPIFCALFVEFLKTRSKNLFTPVFWTIGDICSKQNKVPINILLECGLVEQLFELFQKPALRNQVFWILSNLAIEEKGGEKIINTPNLLLELNTYSRICNNDAIWIISNLATRGSNAVINALLRCGCYPILFQNIRRMTPIQQKLTLEGGIALLQKGKARATISIQPFFTDLEHEFGAEPLFQQAKNALSTIPFELTVVQQPITTIPSTNASTLAAARMTEMLSRGAEPEGVDISDLLFTAGDILYLSNNGFEVRGDGLLHVARVN